MRNGANSTQSYRSIRPIELPTTNRIWLNFSSFLVKNIVNFQKEALSAADKGLLMGRSDKAIGLVEYADELAEAIRATRTDSERNAFKVEEF